MNRETNNSSCILLIGGYPKGHKIPFSPRTLSGKRLWKILSKLPKGVTVKVIDLWETKQQEELGRIDVQLRSSIQQFAIDGWRVISLGHYVHQRLNSYGVTTEYLPHPASRRKQDLQRLEKELTVG